jgi:LuxR family maltose regulon positive regulatory protein
LTLVRVLLMTQQLSEARELLDRLLPLSEAAGRVLRVVEMRCLRAIALHRLGKREQACDDLGRALALAEPEGYISVLLDIGEPLRWLVSDCKLEIGDWGCSRSREKGNNQTGLALFPVYPTN